MVGAVTDDITILIPVLWRPHRVPVMLQKFDGFPVLFLADEGDEETLAELERLGARYEIGPVVPEFGTATYSSKVNHGYRVTGTPYILYASDDIEPRAGWWNSARMKLEANPNVGVLATNDMQHALVVKGKLATHGVVRRSYVEEYGSASLPGSGPVFWEGYRHWNCDVEVSYVARARGAFAYDPQSVIQHLSPRFNARVIDRTYAVGRAMRAADQAKRAQRCPGWPNASQLSVDALLPASAKRIVKPVRVSALGELVQVVMISCEQRAAARNETIPQFSDVGLEVAVTLSPCNPAGPAQNNIASVHALRHAYSQGKHCLFIEDDVDIDGELFKWALAEAVQRDRVTFLYLHDRERRVREFYGQVLADRIMAGLPIRRDLYQLRTVRELTSGQAIFLPYWFYAPIVEQNRLQGTRQSFDVFLSHYLATVRETPLVALPHPVQHRHVRVAREGRGRPEKFSKSFGLPWFASGENCPIEFAEHRLDFRAENMWQFERLLPLWRGVPWSQRGTFYVSTSTWAGMNGEANVARLAGMKDKPVRTVVMDLPGSAWGSLTGAFKERKLIVIGDVSAHVEYGPYGYHHFPQSGGGSEGGDYQVGFLVSQEKTFAGYCRWLPQLAHAVMGAAVAHPARGVLRDELGGSNDKYDHHLKPKLCIGSTSERIGTAGTDWFNKARVHHTRSAIEVLANASVIVSDDEWLLKEAAALGKRTFMMTTEEVLPYHAAGEEAVEVSTQTLVEKLLEVEA